MDAREVELLATVAVADGGISLPLQTVLHKRPFRVTMKIPSSRSQIRMGRLYLKIGVTPEEVASYGFDQKVRFIVAHGTEVSRIVAAGIVRGPILGRLLNRPVAWLLRETMSSVALAEAWRIILTSMSTASFDDIITSVAIINRMQPLVSRNGSESGKRS